MKRRIEAPFVVPCLLLVLSSVSSAPAAAQGIPWPQLDGEGSIHLTAADLAFATDSEAHAHLEERVEGDLSAMQAHRPGYSFWQHIFTIPDGSVAFGSAEDGRLLAVFPEGADWTREGRWEEPSLAPTLSGRRLPPRANRKREEVAELLEPRVGPVLHNATRGRFLLPNARRYGDFVQEWGAIYERFGVPGELGLAQAIVESGFNGRIRSPQGALGFCQWLRRNWERMKRQSPHVIEGYNQTTQAAYCAAHLMILATKYGSYIPALSEHHAGGTNVGRTIINGGRLGGEDVRERYFLGSTFAMDLRSLPSRRFRDLYRTYGPRSFRYAEMVFGNMHNVVYLRRSVPQTTIHAMRAPRPIPIEEVSRRTGLSVDEVRRFNPALVRQVPRSAALYLPTYVADFGPDIAFWHRPPDPAYVEVLSEFVRLDADPEEWDRPEFAVVLEEYRDRFLETETEEGTVVATVLGYVVEDLLTSGRSEILADYRTDGRIQRLFEEGVRTTRSLEGS